MRRRKQTANFYGSDCKNEDEEEEKLIKHAKFLSISLYTHLNGHKHCLRQRFFFSITAFLRGMRGRNFCQSGRGGLLIFMMIIDSMENLSLLLFICPFEGIKYFMKSINIIFSEGDFCS